MEARNMYYKNIAFALLKIQGGKQSIATWLEKISPYPEPLIQFFIGFYLTYHCIIITEFFPSVFPRPPSMGINTSNLYIFQDGMKENTNVEEWKSVNRLIQEIDWCETYVQVSETNKGLAKSIVAGVDYVLQECDAVIVLEDDCVPHPQFMEYMLKALKKYESSKVIDKRLIRRHA